MERRTQRALIISLIIIALISPSYAVSIKEIQSTCQYQQAASNNTCTTNLTCQIGPQGPQGPQGDPGPMNQTPNMTAGPTGPQGPQGDIGPMNQTPNMTAGPAGSAATIAVNYTFPGSPANVVNVGTASAALLDFTIPNGTGGGTSDHGLLSNLTSDSHPQYLLLDGITNRPGGQTVTGNVTFFNGEIVGNSTRNIGNILGIPLQVQNDQSRGAVMISGANPIFKQNVTRESGGVATSLMSVNMTNSTTGQTIRVAQIGFLGAITPTFYNAYMFLTARNDGDYYTNDLRLYPAGNASFGSNLSVGTHSETPAATLYISDAATASVNSLKINGKFVFRGDGIFTWGSTANSGLLSWDTGRTIVGGQSGNNLSLYSGGTEKVTVYSDGSSYFRGRIGIESASPNTNASIQADGTGKFVLPNRMTGAQKEGIVAPPEGATVYDTTNKTLSVNNGTGWQNLGTGTGSSLTQAQVCEMMYPVHSVYISNTTVDPNTVLGCGTWEEL